MFARHAKPTKNILVKKQTILKKTFSVLTSEKIKKPINILNYINIDIPVAPIPFREDQKNYIVGFKDHRFLDSLKVRVQHPYTVSTVQINDIFVYMQKSHANLMVILKGECDIETRQSLYTTLFIDTDALYESIIRDDAYIPVTVQKLVF